MKITLDEHHIYKADGIIYPSTNEILNLYFPPSEWYTEEGREKGTKRHKWYEAIAQGLELENEPDPRIAGAVAGFRKFWADAKPTYLFSEQPFVDPIGVGGKPDLVCILNGRLSIVDYKPKNKNKRTPLQTAAYFHNLRANGHMILDRYELRLLDGDYRLEAHQDKNDIYRWLTMVSAYNARAFYL
ncbi:MAG: hypothetical protein KGL39_19875 [Patescibacteria group bacterium]|nr:hypothetical protein [Patescibacteria group bacterium]